MALLLYTKRKLTKFFLDSFTSLIQNSYSLDQISTVNVSNYIALIIWSTNLIFLISASTLPSRSALPFRPTFSRSSRFSSSKAIVDYRAQILAPYLILLIIQNVIVPLISRKIPLVSQVRQNIPRRFSSSYQLSIKYIFTTLAILYLALNLIQRRLRLRLSFKRRLPIRL